MKRLVYVSGQEGASRKFFEATFNKLALDGAVVQAVPGVSAVGESQSNGLAERGVQLVEELLRTYKIALEDRMQQTLSAQHHVFLRLAEHVGSVYNKYETDKEGEAAYERMHGVPAEERSIEFGERM